MKSPCNEDRRNFIKKVSVGTVGILAAGITPACSSKPEVTGESGWKDNMQINPAIDNLRVVCCHDKSMIKGNPKNWDMQAQNEPVNTERVYAVMDEMAKSLASKENAKEAWQTIFQKPLNKEWKNSKVALKVNCISKNHPRIAVVHKICMELNGLGVPYKNMTIYDSDDDASKFYGQFRGKGLAGEIVVSKMADALGGMENHFVPEPYPGTFKCTKALATGETDILVNIAVNKGHKAKLGKTTLTLKNHAGTFDPQPIHDGGKLEYILAMNKSKAILGGTPTRQQLCIVDSLWGMTGGPFGVPNKVVNRLVMGTFSPAVDYLTAKKIREPVMGVTHKNLARFMTEFGYKDFSNLDLVDVQAPA